MRKLFLTFIFGILVFTLSACGADKTSGTLVVGMECAYAPYNWTTETKTDTAVAIDGTNTYCDGYDVKVAKTIAKSLDMTLVIKAIEWDGLIPALTTGSIDAIIAGMSPTDERKVTINFTDSYFRSEQVVVVRKNSTFVNAQSIRQFNNAKITAQLGTLQEGLTTQMTGAIQQTSLPDYATMVTALKNNTVDGFIAELPVATQIVGNNKDLKIVQFTGNNGFVVDEAEVTTAIGLRKSDTELQNKINSVLSKITVEERNQWMNEFIEKSSS